MEISYTGLDGETYRERLVPVTVQGLVLHATPTIRVPSIMEKGLLTNQPPEKLMVSIPAIFCTIPSVNPSINDLFRAYKDWSIIVLDSDKLNGHSWYTDFLAVNEVKKDRGHQHILTLENIPPSAINQVIDLADRL